MCCSKAARPGLYLVATQSPLLEQNDFVALRHVQRVLILLFLVDVASHMRSESSFAFTTQKYWVGWHCCMLRPRRIHMENQRPSALALFRVSGRGVAPPLTYRGASSCSCRPAPTRPDRQENACIRPSNFPLLALLSKVHHSNAAGTNNLALISRMTACLAKLCLLVKPFWACHPCRSCKGLHIRSMQLACTHR